MQFPLQAHEDDDPDNEEHSDQAYVWGTNINIENIKRRVQRFFEEFDIDESGHSRYLKLIEQVTPFCPQQYANMVQGVAACMLDFAMFRRTYTSHSATTSARAYAKLVLLQMRSNASRHTALLAGRILKLLANAVENLICKQTALPRVQIFQFSKIFQQIAVLTASRLIVFCGTPGLLMVSCGLKTCQNVKQPSGISSLEDFTASIMQMLVPQA